MRFSSLASLISIALPLLVLFLSGCAVNPVTGKKELAFMQISAEKEIAIGEESFPAALQLMGGEYPDPALNAYVGGVGERLGRLSHRADLPYSFKVVNDSSPNAFALPGGFIAVSRGLLVNLENEAQLAAVLGHEVGHVTARHSAQGIQRGALLNASLAVLSGATGGSGYGALAGQAGQVAAGLVDNSYSRDQERESDLLGIDYMVAAGYDPAGAVQLQEFFYRKMEGGAEPMWLAGLFRSHPFSKERLIAVKEYIAGRWSRSIGGLLLPDPLMLATARLRSAAKGYELYDEARRREAGDLGGAVATYLQAAAAAPEESLILAGLGMAYLKAEDVQSARRHLEKAVRLDDDYYRSRMGLGYVYLKLGEGASAVRELKASMDLMPTAEGAFLLAEGYEAVGQTAEALELYRAVADGDYGGKLGKAAAGRVRVLEGR